MPNEGDPRRVLLLTLLLGCAPASSLPGAAGGRTTAPAAIDIDGPGCRAGAEGSLRARGGALWFEGAGPPVLLPQDGGRLSRFVPELGGPLALAVRSGPGAPGGEALSGDTLVVLDPERLTLRPLWSFDGSLRLLGRAGERVVLLAGDGDRGHVVAIDSRARRVIQSPPLPLPPRLWRAGDDGVPGQPLEAGLPWAAPVGPGGWLLRCQGRLCRVQLREDRIEVEELPMEAGALGVWQGRLLLRRGDGQCLEPRRRVLPGRERFRVRRCPRELRHDWAPAAPAAVVVDGALTDDARLRVPACLVRGELLLPEERRRGAAEPGPLRLGAGLVPLPGWRIGRDELALALLVRGQRLRLTFLGEELGARAAALPGHFRLALRPGTALVRHLRAAGLFQVELRAPVPLPAERCFRGELELRASQDGGDDAVLRRPWRSLGCPARE